MYWGLYRVGTDHCRVDKAFVYNESFRCVSGSEFFVDGEPRFPKDVPAEFRWRDGAYRTVFGPAVAHNGYTICKCNECERLALRRLTACREGCPVFERRLQQNQLRALHLANLHGLTGSDGTRVRESTTLGECDVPRLHQHCVHCDKNRELEQRSITAARRIRDLLSRIRTIYSPTITEHFTNTLDEASDHHADPHPKKTLRIHAWGKLLDYGHTARLWLKDVLYKLKRVEISKVGKYGRMIGDLGVAASLQGFRLTNAVKIAQDENVIELNGGHARFVKAPSPDVLKDCFDKLINPPGRFYFVYFSDDACYSVRDKSGRVRMYNLDISSCDASHGPHVFDALIDLMPNLSSREAMQVLVDQCKLPIRIVDVDRPRRRVLLRPKSPRLYSGSTITTAINNIANLLICDAITANPDLTPIEAAATIGYIITLDECFVPEHLQFLKHSPIRTTTGEYHPLINLGVILRLSGVAKGDLPGRGDLFRRARQFQHALLNGVAPGSSFSVIDNMRAATGVTEPQTHMTKFAEAQLADRVLASASLRFCDDSIYLRYELDGDEVTQLLHFSTLPQGWVANSPALSKVLTKDYGLL